jgi:hypothetical protein
LPAPFDSLTLAQGKREGAAAALVFVAAWAFRFLSVGALENDHFVSLARAHQVLHGAWPVRDFFDPGQPLAYLTSAAAAAIGGPTLLTEVVLAVVIIALGASVTFVLARRASGSVLIALAAVGLELAAYPRLYNGAKLLIPLIAIWLGWRYADRPPATARLAALAVWSAIAFLWRHDFAVYIVVASLVLISLCSRIAREVATRRIATFLALVVVCLLPWAAYVQWAGGLGFYIASASRFAAVEAQRTSSPDNLPLLIAIVAIPFVATLLVRMLPPSVLTGQWLTYAHVVFIAALAMAMDLVFLRDRIAARFADVAGPTVVLIAWFAGRVPAKFIRWAGGAAVAIAAIGVIAVLARQGFRVPTPGGVVRRFQMETTNLREAKPEAVPDHALLPIVRYLAECTPATDRVLVSGFAPQIPVLAHRPFAAGLPAWLPGYYTNPSDVERAAALLSRESVSLVVMLEGSDVFTKQWPRLATDLRSRGFVERTWRLDDRSVVVWLPANRARDTPACQS